jgi:hypothetical protein
MKSVTSNMVILVSTSLTIFGCSKQEEPARTVSWFEQHAEERKSVLARCTDDPGHLAQTPNCVNAKQAESIEGIGSFRKLPPLGLDPNRKPGFEDEKKPTARP